MSSPSKKEGKVSEKSSTEEKKALTIRMEPELFDMIDKVADELGQNKSATVARNYLQLANYVFVKADMQITTHDNNPLLLIPSTLFETMTSLIKDENSQKDIGDRLATLINLNAEILNLNNISQKIEFLKVLGWLPRMGGDFLRIPRKFGPPMLVASLVHRLVTKKKIEWPLSFFLENFADPKWEKEKTWKAEKTRFLSIRDEFTQKFGIWQGIFTDTQDSPYYDFDKIIIREPTPK